MKLKKIILLILSSLLLACAGNQKKQSEIDEVFVTDIKENGIKLFSYTLSSNPGDGEGRGRGKGRQGGNGSTHDGNGGMRGGKHGGNSAGSVDRESYRLERVQEKLDAKLEENGFCREGYIELSSYATRGQSQIRGECREGATDLDREKFASPAFVKTKEGRPD